MRNYQIIFEATKVKLSQVTCCKDSLSQCFLEGQRWPFFPLKQGHHSFGGYCCLSMYFWFIFFYIEDSVESTREALGHIKILNIFLIFILKLLHFFFFHFALGGMC